MCYVLYFKLKLRLVLNGLHMIIWKAPIFLAEREKPRENCGRREEKKGENCYCYDVHTYSRISSSSCLVKPSTSI